MLELHCVVSAKQLCLSLLLVLVFVVGSSAYREISLVQNPFIGFVSQGAAFLLSVWMDKLLITVNLSRHVWLGPVLNRELISKEERASLIQFVIQICAEVFMVSSLVSVIGELLYSIAFCLSSWQYYPRVIFKTCTAGLVLHR